MRLIPRESKFFRMFADVSQNLTQGTRLLQDILKNPANMEPRLDQLQEIEHRGDEMTHGIITALNQTFITPFDREDIHRLTSSLDDVLDYVNAAGVRLRLYKIKSPPSIAAELAAMIVEQSEELAQGVSLLEKNKLVLEHCVEVHRLENEADRLSRKAIADLFDNEKDPIHLIKIKELYEVLETATDKAEDAANVLEAVALKSN
ncbi:MAG: phosphate transport regulator [Acidobacteriales bacterium 13_2_20CM_55_8]|jgi:predicted phosphate transport protein (TIGR00153 family)|nr:MAG: phosphate transport regulator [Acidobacteriales bacterium 13_2_20CM_55_8]